jgi:hypothetical protein
MMARMLSQLPLPLLPPGAAEIAPGSPFHAFRLPNVIAGPVLPHDRIADCGYSPLARSTARADWKARNFAAASAASVSGSESATMPPPANMRALAPMT